MSTAQMVDKYAGTDVISSFEIKDIILGDVNGDGDVDIADAVRIVNLVLGKIDALARRRQTSLPEPE